MPLQKYKHGIVPCCPGIPVFPIRMEGQQKYRLAMVPVREEKSEICSTFQCQSDLVDRYHILCNTLPRRGNSAETVLTDLTL